MKFYEPTFTYTGMELSPQCIRKVQKFLAENEVKALDVLEFGSGQSTEGFLDFLNLNRLPGVYDCFDASKEYAHPIAKIKPLINLDTNLINLDIHNLYVNTFYVLEEVDFNSREYGLVVLDGHHGPGRSEAWKYTVGRLKKNCIVVIDDYDHYPFVERFLTYYPKAQLLAKHWEVNERWVIYRV